ncbi:SpoIIE family protein phosphatase [Streptomyces sp. 4N509B]|uniref:SpoIIE family protein phosphatase n=1 Tax=Streptomyces sp. 4N509B TaxID=3457413 RepID=UPI003FD23A41
MTPEHRQFGGAALLALYLPSQPGGPPGDLVLSESTGAPVTRYGLAVRYPLHGRSPVSEAVRAGRPLWLRPTELATFPEEGAPTTDVSLGVIPLGAEDGMVGCLLAVDDAPDGFDADRRGFLELYAAYLTERLETASDTASRAASPTPSTPSDAATATAEQAQRPTRTRTLARVRLGSFALTLQTGHVEADPAALALLGTDRVSFDHRVETLLAQTVPEDVPALMSIVEPAAASPGGRELEFRIRPPDGELRWLYLRCRVLAGADGRPRRLLGVVADATVLRPGVDDVARIRSLSATLAAAVTVSEVSDATIAALRELGADRVLLAEPEADRLVVAVLEPPEPEAWPGHWREQWPEVPGHCLPTLFGALREGRTRLWPAGSVSEPELAQVGPGGLAVLPLTAAGRPAGVCLVGWEEPHTFATEERFLLTAAAGLVGQAMARARAFDAQHELAAMLQRSLLPRALPSLPGAVAVARYLPATAGLDVGGDWYDVIPLSDRHVALVIGDVQGHSAAAATIMGQIRTAIRAYAVEGHSPDVVVSHANRLLVGMETDLFATCCYVAMDMEEGNTWIVRAGHLPPLVRDPDGGTREIEVEGGPPLGVVADTEFPMSTVGLAPGCVVAMLTDGLVESAGLRMEDGLARVREALAAADPADLEGLADTLLEGAGRLDDDVALLLLRYDGMRVRPHRAGWAVWRLPDAVGHARRFTGRTLRSWQVEEDADAALLIVSELVTNALTHTQGPVRLDLTLAGSRLRVAVSDSSPRTPVKAESADWEATGGRGIMLVAAVSDSWGSVPLSGGKQVWAEIVLAPRDEDAPTGSEKRVLHQ